MGFNSAFKGLITLYLCNCNCPQSVQMPVRSYAQYFIFSRPRI